MSFEYQRVGPVIAVSSVPGSTESAPASAALPDGRWVVAWSEGPTIRAQLFDADGSRSGTTFEVPAPDAAWESGIAVTPLAGGGFLISWRDEVTGSGTQVRARLFDATAAPAGGEVVVVPSASSWSLTSAFAALPGGGFVAVWGDHSAPHVLGRIFDASGAPAGETFMVSGRDYGTAPQVEATPDGGFAVSWQGGPQYSSSATPMLRFFDPSGAPETAPIVLDSTGGWEAWPDLAVLASGGVVATWRDGADGEIKARLFDSSGTALGAEFRVNADAWPSQQRPVAAALPSGGFAVAWGEDMGMNGHAVKLQLFGADGTRAGAELTLAEGLPTYSNPALSVRPDGAVLVSWSDDASYGTVPAGAGIKSQLLMSARPELSDTPGDDALAGTGAHELIRVGQGGTDTVSGGAGFDRLVIDARLLGGPLDLAAAPGDGGFSGTASWSGASLAFSGIEEFTVHGTDGDDRVVTGSGHDEIWLGAGDDFADVGSGYDSADGGSGRDGISVDLSALAGPVVWDIAAAPTGAVARFTSFEYFGTLVTGAGADRIDSGRGLDDETLRLGAGNDRATVYGGRDTLEGGAGSDHLTIDWRSAATAISIGSYSADPAGGFRGVFGDGGVYRAEFTGFEEVRLWTGSGADHVVAGSTPLQFDLGAGDDLFEGTSASRGHGGEGIDGLIFTFTEAGRNLDFFLGGNNHYLEQAWPSDDVYGKFTGFEYFKLYVGGSGIDHISDSGLALNDTVRLGAGVDYLTIRNGHDTADGGADSDVLELRWEAATSAVVGEALPGDGATMSGTFADGATRRIDFTGFEHLRLHTGSGNDHIVAGNGAVTVYSGAGDDFVRTGSGNDVIDSGAGDDRIDVGSGSDAADGGDGVDGLAADRRTDTVGQIWNLNRTGALATAGPIGPGFYDFEYYIDLRLGSGSDQVTTRDLGLADKVDLGAGDDFLTLFDGHDQAEGGSGWDRLTVNWSTKAEAVTLTATAGAAGGVDGILAAGGTRSVALSGFEDLMIYTGAGNDVIRTGSAWALVSTGDGNDVIETGDLADTLSGGRGADRMTGGRGNDLYYVDDAGDVVIELTDEGTDEVRSTLSTYVLPDHVERLRLTGSGQTATLNGLDNVVIGSAGNDLFRLQQGGDDDARGGLGSDGFFLGAALTSADRIDGGDGRDYMTLQGDYGSPLALGPGVVNLELVTLLSGSDTRYGLSGTDLLSYHLVTHDSNVAAGQQLIVDGGGLQAGETFTFDGSAETNGSYRVWGGFGTDLLRGGGGGDIFYFGAGRFGADDRVDGGGGTFNQLSLMGDYNIAFGAEQLVNINAFVFLGGRGLASPADHDYVVTMHDLNIAAGVRAVIDGGQLAASETLTFDGSAETDGSFRIFGGAGADRLTGSQGSDSIVGAGGRDVLEGRAGADTFVYRSAADSTSLAHDRIVGFVFGEDLIDLPGSHDAYEVKSGGALSLAGFDEDLAAAMAGTLEAMEAVLFTADAGDLAGRLFLIVDQNGTAGYQAGEDFVIELAGTAAPLGPIPDFIV